MTQTFQIAVEEWISGENSDRAVEATLAEISIKVGPYYVTKVEDRRAKTVRRCIRASAALLATWLLSNWWRLRWEPYKDPGDTQRLDWQLSHSLPSIGQGYVWPPLTFASDGNNIFIKCQGQDKGDPELLSPIRYLNSFVHLVRPTDFEEGVQSFVECVIERLNAIKLQDTVVHQLWLETRFEQRSPEQASLRKLEALLGLDPQENEGLIEALARDWQIRVGKAALEEIAAASKTHDVQRVLNVAAKEETSLKTFAQFPDRDHIRAGLKPWQPGVEASHVLRDHWGLGNNPISTKNIAEHIQISLAALNEDHPNTPFSFGVRHDNNSEIGFIFARHNEHSRRFDLARLIADHYFQNSNDKWVPATPSFTARQRFQRVFAAEFLCPAEELKHRYGESIKLDDVDDVVLSISEEFNVSQSLVLNHLVNQGLISQWIIEPTWGFADNYRQHDLVGSIES